MLSTMTDLDHLEATWLIDMFLEAIDLDGTVDKHVLRRRDTRVVLELMRQHHKGLAASMIHKEQPNG